MQDKAHRPSWHYLLLVPAFLAAAYMGYQIEARPGQEMTPEEGAAIFVCFAVPFGAFMLRQFSSMLTREASRAELFGEETVNVFVPLFGTLVAGLFIGAFTHAAMVRLWF